MFRVPFILVPMLVLVLLGGGDPAVARPEDDREADREAVRMVVLDYFEGWFTGDAERFLSALHPELAKRIPQVRDGSWVLHPSDREEMADYIRSGRSVRDLEVADIEVEVYDVRHGVATAMGSCNTFFDYVHLARLDGEWKIVNVLWQQWPDEE